MASTSRIVELASAIQAHTADIDSYLRSQGLSSPDWDLDTPPTVLLSDAAQASQNALLEAMEELKALVLGPVPFLINKAIDAVRGSARYFIGQAADSGESKALYLACTPSFVSTLHPASPSPRRRRSKIYLRRVGCPKTTLSAFFVSP